MLWLERFTGDWERAGTRVEINRRSDGGLAARDAEASRQPLIDLLSGDWIKVEPPPGPLGMRPVMLSGSLIGLWLEPEEAKKYAYAMFVSSGPKILMNKIETVINETPQELRERKWLSWWQHNAERQLETMTSEDLAEHHRLFDWFQRELS